MKPRTEQGKISSLSPKGWYMKMKEEPCFILGNAPSIKDIDLSVLDNLFTIGINRIFFIHDPTILLWQDLALWIQEKRRVMESESIKYCRRGSETKGGFYNFTLGGRDAQITHDPSIMHGRGSSGSIAYQLAWALGCDPIVLVGMDCKNDKEGNTDFYGKNPMHKPHTLPHCKRALTFIRGNAHGRQIINCSHNEVFKETWSLEAAVDLVKYRKRTREEYVKMLIG